MKSEASVVNLIVALARKFECARALRGFVKRGAARFAFCRKITNRALAHIILGLRKLEPPSGFEPETY